MLHFNTMTILDKLQNGYYGSERSDMIDAYYDPDTFELFPLWKRMWNLLKLKVRYLINVALITITVTIIPINVTINPINVTSIGHSIVYNSIVYNSSSSIALNHTTFYYE